MSPTTNRRPTDARTAADLEQLRAGDEANDKAGRLLAVPARAAARPAYDFDAAVGGRLLWQPFGRVASARQRPAGLDQPGEAGFYRLIDEVRRETGAAVLMVSHDLHVVMAASDRVICLNGHICCQGSPVVVSNAPEYRALFGLGSQGALALYQHQHDHSHEPTGVDAFGRAPSDPHHGHNHA